MPIEWNRLTHAPKNARERLEINREAVGIYKAALKDGDSSADITDIAQLVLEDRHQREEVARLAANPDPSLAEGRAYLEAVDAQTGGVFDEDFASDLQAYEPDLRLGVIADKLRDVGVSEEGIARAFQHAAAEQRFTSDALARVHTSPLNRALGGNFANDSRTREGLQTAFQRGLAQTRESDFQQDGLPKPIEREAALELATRPHLLSDEGLEITMGVLGVSESTYTKNDAKAMREFHDEVAALPEQAKRSGEQQLADEVAEMRKQDEAKAAAQPKPNSEYFITYPNPD